MSKGIYCAFRSPPPLPLRFLIYIYPLKQWCVFGLNFFGPLDPDQNCDYWYIRVRTIIVEISVFGSVTLLKNYLISCSLVYYYLYEQKNYDTHFETNIRIVESRTQIRIVMIKNTGSGLWSFQMLDPDPDCDSYNHNPQHPATATRCLL